MLSLLVLAPGRPAQAQGTSATATMSVAVTSQARLTLSSASLVFPDADPDAVPLVSAVSGPIAITAKVRAGGASAVTLTVQASDDLRSGITLLPASLLSWTATGGGFVDGTLSKSAAQAVAAWTGSGSRSGTQNYLFTNSWSHPSGTYSVTLVYTLSTP